MSLPNAQPKPSSHAAEKQAHLRAKERLWQELRRQVLQRDLYRCRVCGSPEQVDVHHIRFRSRGGADTSSNTACLCRVHHAELHAYRLVLQGNADGTLVGEDEYGTVSRYRKRILR